MPPLDLVVAVAVAIVVMGPFVAAAAVHGSRARARMAFWLESAREAGLSDNVRSPNGTLTGCSGQLQVRLSYYQDGEFGGTRVEVWSPSLITNLTLRAEGVGAFLGLRDRKEIEVGDDDFDRQVSVRGTPALALALLDPDMRRTVRAMLRGHLMVRGHSPLWVSGRLEEGVLHIDVPERSSVARGGPAFLREVEALVARRSDKPDLRDKACLDGEGKLPAILRAALDLAGRLVVPEDLPRRIASNLASEPEPRVRQRAFLMLLREFPEHAATREALAAARADPDADIRLRAGIALGADGRDVLIGVAGGEGAEDATSARAVAALGASLTLEQAVELLKNALRTRRLGTARACLGILGRHGKDATATLARVLLVERGELGEAAAEALAATDDPSAEAPLVRALSEGPEELCRAAAAALGRVGTRDAVAPLREAEQQVALRGVARQAIAQIHARLGGAAQGQLSLAGGESGQLSLAEDEAGRLSLSEGEPKAGKSQVSSLRDRARNQVGVSAGSSRIWSSASQSIHFSQKGSSSSLPSSLIALRPVSLT